MTGTSHIPVLLEEVLCFLWDDAPLGAKARTGAGGSSRPVFLDCTLGAGGHTEALLERSHDGVVVGLDRDPEAVERARTRLQRFADRVLLLPRNFADASAILAEEGERIAALVDRPVSGFTGVLADLGISSYQLDDPLRGFSFRYDGPLDMRMDMRQPLSAADVLNSYEARDLMRVFQRGGMRQGARVLVDEVLRRRPVRTTSEFARITEQALAKFEHRPGRHPGTVAFQALRIEVNQELESLDELLDGARELVDPEGRLAIISFHSLEDRAVAQAMRKWVRGERTPLHERQATRSFGRLLTPQAVAPGADEMRQNPRARSARLRVFERAELDGVRG